MSDAQVDWEDDNPSGADDGLDDSPDASPAQDDATAEEFVASVSASEDDPTDELPLDSAVEDRILLIQAYSVLLGNGYLFEARSAEGDQVNREVRQFIREKLNVLLGMAAPQPQRAAVLFNPEEVDALKKLAKAAISRFGAAPVQASPAPAPQLKRVPATAAAQPERPLAPRVPRPALPARKRVVQTFDAASVVSRLPSRYREDPTLQVRGGRAFVQQVDSNGTPKLKVRKSDGKMSPALKDVTPPSVPAPTSPQQPVPTPTEEQGMMIGAAQAAFLSSRVGSSQILGGVLQHSINSVSVPREDDRP